MKGKKGEGGELRGRVGIEGERRDAKGLVRDPAAKAEDAAALAAKGGKRGPGGRVCNLQIG